ncbi:MAG: hypothetical protein ACK5NG_00650 [Chthoniobacterales bacterium]
MFIDFSYKPRPVSEPMYKTIVFSFILTLSSLSVFAAETKIETEVKSATAIAGKGGIYEWKVTSTAETDAAWSATGPVLMDPAIKTMVSMEIIHRENGDSMIASLGATLNIEAADFKAFDSVSRAKNVMVFTLNDKPGAARFFNGETTLYLTVVKDGGMDQEKLLKDMVAILVGASIERVEK